MFGPNAKPSSTTAAVYAESGQSSIQGEHLSRSPEGTNVAENTSVESLLAKGQKEQDLDCKMLWVPANNCGHYGTARDDKDIVHRNSDATESFALKYRARRWSCRVLPVECCRVN